jgi:hypothetical protein
MFIIISASNFTSLNPVVPYCHQTEKLKFLHMCHFVLHVITKLPEQKLHIFPSRLCHFWDPKVIDASTAFASHVHTSAMMLLMTVGN